MLPSLPVAKRERPKSCSRVRPDGPLSVKKAEIVLKGAPGWTLAREKRGYKKRNRPGGFPEAVGVVPGDSVGIRTQDPQLRRLLLYPAELRNQKDCKYT